jgi:hypothetical protein
VFELHRDPVHVLAWALARPVEGLLIILMLKGRSSHKPWFSSVHGATGPWVVVCLQEAGVCEHVSF